MVANDFSRPRSSTPVRDTLSIGVVVAVICCIFRDDARLASADVRWRPPGRAGTGLACTRLAAMPMPAGSLPRMGDFAGRPSGFGPNGVGSSADARGHERGMVMTAPLHRS